RGVGPAVAGPVALAQDGDELGREQLGEGGLSGPGGHGGGVQGRRALTAYSGRGLIKQGLGATARKWQRVVWLRGLLPSTERRSVYVRPSIGQPDANVGRGEGVADWIVVF